MSNYDPKYERQRELMADNRLDTEKFTIFDDNSRIYKRTKINSENYLVLISDKGEVILLSESFERQLYFTVKERFE